MSKKKIEFITHLPRDWRRYIKPEWHDNLAMSRIRMKEYPSRVKIIIEKIK